MEATALSVGKSVLDGALGYARSALAEEVALQLGIQRDHAFIRDELQMMQAFLKAAHDDPDKQEVLMAWVKQVRDVAYDAEDCLQDFSIHLKEPSWWRLPRTLRERRRIAKQMKELRNRVEDVSQRNLRYQLTKSSSFKPATGAEMSSITSATTIFGVGEARRAARQEEPKEDLVSLINKEDEKFRVIALWGTSGDLGLTTIINKAYQDPQIKRKFPCRAWIRILHPFNPNDFIQSLVKQFRSAEGVDILLENKKTEHDDLAKEFIRYVNEKSYLIVLNDLATFEDWNVIRTCFLPSSEKGSRIIVCTSQVEIASLCVGQEYDVLELKQLSADQTVYAFFEKLLYDHVQDSRNRKEIVPLPMSSFNEATTSSNISMVLTNETLGDQSEDGYERKVATKSLSRIKTITSAVEESQFIGREKEMTNIVKLLSYQSSQEIKVISVWGMGGVGKTTLVKDVYQSQRLINMFDRRVFITIFRPFDRKEFLKRLVMNLAEESSKTKRAIELRTETRNKVETMGVDLLIKELERLTEEKNCLIVLDDLSSTKEWDDIMDRFPKLGGACRILVTTRDQIIAKHCSKKQDNIYKVEVLEDSEALNLFTRKVFKEAIDWDKHPDLNKEAKLILKKCNGLPLAIVTIGGLLANRPKIAVEWRKLIEHISAELEMNPELETIRTILCKSYDGLPYHLKSCFLYTSIFPEDHKISRRRMIRRWVAEGYSREIRQKPAEEVSDSYFMELIDRSMILPSNDSIGSRKRIDSCQVHDLMREISISKSAEESLVFRLEEGCSSNTQEIVRHLTVSSNWMGDRTEFESAVDLSRIRSLTVFGQWRSFYISKKMRLLRVLDLENITGLVDHHLEHIGSLLHLKYISLRGCNNIFHLPNSWGNLLQLEILDIKDTSIIKLPRAILRLRKLQYLRARLSENLFGGTYQELIQDEDIPKPLRNKLCLSTIFLVACCAACCMPQSQLVEDLWGVDSDPNRCDVCTAWCCTVFPSVVVTGLDVRGVAVPSRVFKKLTALHTLGTVNIGRHGRAVLEDIKRLTRLRKLGVAGVTQKNYQDLGLALSALRNLESLSLWSLSELPDDGSTCALEGKLKDLSLPESLKSLKLHGSLCKLPQWIIGLRNLMKLSLEDSVISDHVAAIKILGGLQKLSILRIGKKSFTGKEGVCFSFECQEFPSLKVLELWLIWDLKSVEFKQGSMPELELLQFCGYPSKTSSGFFRGLGSLPRLKEFLLDNDIYGEDFLKDVQDQLGGNTNEPFLKRLL